MWFKGQWIWDREKKEPVKFVGITLSGYDNPSVFHVETVKSVKENHPFTDASWWMKRYTELYDEKKGILI